MPRGPLDHHPPRKRPPPSVGSMLHGDESGGVLRDVIGVNPAAKGAPSPFLCIEWVGVIPYALGGAQFQEPFVKGTEGHAIRLQTLGAVRVEQPHECGPKLGIVPKEFSEHPAKPSLAVIAGNQGCGALGRPCHVPFDKPGTSEDASAGDWFQAARKNPQKPPLLHLGNLQDVFERTASQIKDRRIAQPHKTFLGCERKHRVVIFWPQSHVAMAFVKVVTPSPMSHATRLTRLRHGEFRNGDHRAPRQS
jgi:hypothetical protein